jgi:septal ring factor EnvC (AmiA/AmiB activator)
MEKYMVIVNQKYLVSVQAESLGGAEHRCLDLVYGISDAQAFSRDDIRTEFFRDNAILCETLSFSELVSKSDAFKAALDYESEVREALDKTRNEMAELQRKLEQLKNSEQALHDHLMESIDERAKII